MRGNLNSHTIFYKLLPRGSPFPRRLFHQFFITRQLYPLRGWNYRLYEHSANTSGSCDSS